MKTRWIVGLVLAVLMFGEVVSARPVFEPLRPWSEREHPGVCHVDAWGWHGAIWYQREYESGASWEYMRDKVINESYHAGANLLEVFPRKYFSKHTGGQGKFKRREVWPWKWEEDVIGFGKLDWYAEVLDPRWSNDTFRKLNRYVHQKNMLVQWFCHPELCQSAKGGEPVFKDPKKIEVSLQAIEALGAMFANATRSGWRDMYDGFGHEHWFMDPEGLTLGALWEYNPGHYCYSMNHCTTHSVDEPGYSESLSCGPTGRDDQLILPKTYGRVFLSQQANSRSRKPPAQEWGRTVYGGFSHPDWIVKQTNDFFRGRLYANGKPDATAIWWLGESITTTPAEYRQYVYGACMDPMRCAAAGSLLATGVSGRLDILGEMHDFLGGRNYGMDAERTQCPASGYFIQNNYLKLEISPNRNYSRLIYDPSHSGHFDDDSNSVTVAEPFVEFYCDGESLTGEAELELVESLESEGGVYGLVVGHGDLQKGTFPAVLARDEQKEDVARRTLHIMREFKAGKYRLKLFVSPDEKLKSKLSVTAKLGERFIETVIISEDKKEYEVAFAVPVSGMYDITLQINEGHGAAVEKIEILKEKKPVTFVHSMKVVEPAGHLAALEMTSYVVDESGEVKGTIVTLLKLAADLPYMSIRQKVSKLDGFDISCKATFSNYDVKKEKDQFICKSDNGSPEIFLTAKPKPSDSTKWSESEKSFVTNYSKGKRGFCLTSLGLVDELQGACDADLHRNIRYPMGVVVEPGADGLEYRGPNTDKPIVSVVRVMNPVGSPYYVKEYGADGKAWWYFRGAQSSKEIAGTDLLRLYLSPGKKVQVIFDGFIDELARPGWGSQYSMVLGDVKKTKDDGSLKAKVISLTPFIFAPRVQFDGDISKVKVNGKQWAYFDKDVVFLPQEKGVYDIKVELGQGCDRPHLTRTTACVERCYFDEKTKSLKIKWKMPSWSKLPGELLFTANINSGDSREPGDVAVTGGEVM